MALRAGGAASLKIRTSMSRPSRVSQPIRILSVSEALSDHVAMRRSIPEIPCQILTIDTCRGASQLLHRGRISIVICESNLPDGTWRDILNCVRTSSEKPILIVTSRFADEYLWAEVLNLGGFDVVAKPFNIEELRHVLETVCLGLAPQVERN